MVVISYAKSCAYTPRASLHLSQMGFSGKWLFAFWELLGFKAMSERSATCNFQGHCVGRKPPETNDFSFSFKLCLLKYPPRFSTKRDARNSHGFFRLSLPFGGDLGVFTMGYIYIYMSSLEGSPTQRLKDVPFSHTKRGFVSRVRRHGLFIVSH